MQVIDEKKIPSLFPHNHASNLLPLSNGDLLCVWFGGSREGKADISILCSRLKKGEEHWSKPVVLSNDPERSEQNPILFKNPNGDIWLMYTAQHKIYQESSIVYYRTSKDQGETWSDIKVLFDKPGTFIRNVPVVLDNGDIVLPAYYSQASDNGFLSNDYSVVKISSDNGITWKEYEVPNSRGLVHMSIEKTSKNELVGFFRSRRADSIYRTISVDNGRTWTEPVKIGLPNNNSSIQCTRLLDGRLALVFNNTNAEENPPKENRPPWFDKKDMDEVMKNSKGDLDAIWGVIRAPLSLAISDDDGLTWQIVKDLATKEEAISETDSPEFSYPSIKQAEDGTIHVTFTYLRQYIKHVQLNLNKSL